MQWAVAPGVIEVYRASRCRNMRLRPLLPMADTDVEPVPSAPYPPRHTMDLSTAGESEGPVSEQARVRRGPRRQRVDRLSELYARMAAQEEVLERIRRGLSMLCGALNVHPADTTDDSLRDDVPAHRPPRATRRGGANCINNAHYKNSNRGSERPGIMRTYVRP